MNGMITTDKALVRLGISRSTLYKLMEDPKFPKPVRILKRRLMWIPAELDRWVKNKQGDRNGQ